MVKKKVRNSSSVRSKSSSSNSKIKKLHFTIPKSKIKSPQENNFSEGAELLNIVNTSVNAKPTVLPNVDEKPVGTPNVDTKTAEKLLEKNSEDNDPKWIKILALVLFSMILLFWLMVILLSINISFGPTMVEKNVTLISYSPVKTSFERFSQISGSSYSEQTSVLGYLRLESTTNNEGIESTTRYVVDDYNNKIRLIVEDKYFGYFSVNSKSTYNVSGLYHNTLTEYVLDAETIVKQNRELIESSTQRLENVSEGRPAGIRIDLSQGWGKISSILSYGGR